MARELITRIADMKAPISGKLEILREMAPRFQHIAVLRDWALRQLEMKPCQLAEWTERAWWGLMAGEVTRAHLYDKDRCDEALELFDHFDFSLVEQLNEKGGVILATSHLGPPKMAMNLLMRRKWPLMVWTNTNDMPDWLPGSTNAVLMNPMDKAQQSLLMVKSALHLRQGGVLFGAADSTSGARLVQLNRLRRGWKFALGLPNLAQRLQLPVLLLLALWEGNRVRIVTKPLPTPPITPMDTQWELAWIEAYWQAMEPVIVNSPENLRFLSSVPGCNPYQLPSE